MLEKLTLPRLGGREIAHLFCAYPLVILYLVGASNISFAASTPLERNIEQDVELAHEIQAGEEEWEDERLEMESLIERLQSQKSRLQTQVDALEWKNNKSQKQVARLSAEVAKATQLTEGLEPIIKQQAEVAHRVFNAGLPFLRQEREMRLTALEDWLKAPASEQAEKLERLLEFFTIEAQFGHTSESWQSVIELDGQQLTVELLKIGRLALFYQTLDRKGCGVYQPETGSFSTLDEGCSQLNEAMALANRERSAELVTLPIGKVVLP